MKKVVGIFSICIALLFAWGALSMSQDARMQRAERCFARNEAALRMIAQRFDAGERSGLTEEELHGVQKMVVAAEPAHLVVYTGAFGIAPSSVYSGFYYSPADEPLAFEPDKVLHEGKDGWHWQGPGDNRGYTQRICENWFYFEASY